MSSKFIHTVAAGVTNQVGVAGSILGIGETTQTITAAELDSASLSAAGIGLAQVPLDAVINVGAILGTPLTAGSGNAAFADQAAIDNGITQPPILNFELFYNGTVWTRSALMGSGNVATFTITDGGFGYATGTGISTAPVANENRPSTGLTVDITSVDGSGAITGVSVNTGGHAWEVGDTVNVVAGSGSAVLTVATITLPVIGQLNTGRSGNVINDSNLVSFPLGLTGSDFYLKQPTTGVIMRYDSSLTPSGYSFSGDTFNGSDFTIQIVTVANDLHVGTVTVASGATTNTNITTTR